MKTNSLKILVGGALLGLSASLFAQSLILNGQTIELDPDEAVSISPVSGDITVQAADPDLTCSSGGPLPVITSFEVDPTTVAQGGSVEISWSSQDADSCEGEGNLPGWAGTNQPTSGPEVVPIASGQAPGNYSVGLICSNSEGDDEEGPVTVTVESAGGTGCDSSPPPSGMTRETTMFLNQSNQTTQWSHVYGGGNEFPHAAGNTATISIPNDHYGALAFNTDNLQTGQEGKLDFDVNLFPTDHNVATPLVVVSECPGDFGPQSDSRCRAIPSFGFTPFRWIEASAITGTTDRCPIERDQDLYLNMVPADTIPSGQNVTWSCEGSTFIANCGFITTAQ